MPSYRIHRLKPHLRQPFRYAPHVSGTAAVKPRDYQEDGEVEAPTPYAAFFALQDSSEPLEVGDLLEHDGELRIFKFVGFEAAEWVQPELKEAPSPEGPPAPGAAAIQ